MNKGQLIFWRLKLTLPIERNYKLNLQANTLLWWLELEEEEVAASPNSEVYIGTCDNEGFATPTQSIGYRRRPLQTPPSGTD